MVKKIIAGIAGAGIALSVAAVALKLYLGQVDNILEEDYIEDEMSI